VALVEADLPLAALAESLVPALIGLLGVVVGAGLSFFLGERAERSRARGATLAAARLVDDELAHVLPLVERTVGQLSEPSPALAARLETPAWPLNRAALAVGLEREQWATVRDAFASVAAFRAALDGGARRELDEHGREALNDIQKAQSVLEAF
jgi:hypothetical protein